MIAPAQRQIPPQNATIAVVTRRETQLDSLRKELLRPAWAGQMDPALPKSITSGQSTREVNL